MNRALREIAQKSSIVDLVVELRDARAVLSSANPDLLAAIKERKHLIVLTKRDLAEERETRKWISYFRERGLEAIAVNLLDSADVASLVASIVANGSDKRARDASRGMRVQPARVMVVGVPNVGKSTMINKLAKKRAAQVENRPGKTRAQQWIKVGDMFDLLDTPGILPMKFNDPKEAVNLALLGMVKESILPKEELALKALSYLSRYNHGALEERYSLGDIALLSPNDILRSIALKHGSISGGGPDIARAASDVLVDFRNGKIARVSLEAVDHALDI